MLYVPSLYKARQQEAQQGRLSLIVLNRFPSFATATKQNGNIIHINWVDSPQMIHYENTPIQIYRKFHLQKTENLLIKTLIFFIFLLKT